MVLSVIHLVHVKLFYRIVSYGITAFIKLEMEQRNAPPNTIYR